MGDPGSPLLVRRVPTAVHAVADVHETPLSSAREPGAPGGIGRLSGLQIVPFQKSATGLVSPMPTAVQTRGDVQDTARPPSSPGSGGRLWSVQCVPSHCSAAAPTEMHALAEVHDTLSRFADSSGSAGVSGAGVLWMLQLLPSQPCAIDSKIPLATGAWVPVARAIVKCCGFGSEG
jgi:hypothetical protein